MWTAYGHLLPAKVSRVFTPSSRPGRLLSIHEPRCERHRCRDPRRPERHRGIARCAARRRGWRPDPLHRLHRRRSAEPCSASWSTAFGAGFSDSAGQAPDAAGITVEGTGGSQVRAAGEQIAAGIAAGGADRDLILADGNAMPGGMALAMTLWEYQVHGWDLAVATGQGWAPAPDAVEGSIAFADQMLTPDFQGEGKSFAARVSVAADAPAIDRLVALSGRDPQWSPAP